MLPDIVMLVRNISQMMLAYFSYLVMGLHLKCSQKLIKVFVFPVINPCAVNKIRVVLLLTTYEAEVEKQDMVCQLGVQLFLKGCTLAMCGKKQIREENKCLNNTMILAHKGQFVVPSNKESQHIRTLISSLPFECMISQRFSVSFVQFVVQCFVDQCLPFSTFFICSMNFLSLLDFRLLINPLESSNFSYRMNIHVFQHKPSRPRQTLR